MLNWRLLSRRTRSPEACSLLPHLKMCICCNRVLIKHVEEMGSMDRLGRVLAH